METTIQVLVFWAIMWFGFKFNPLRIVKGIMKPLISAIIMSFIGILMQKLYKGVIVQLLSVWVCIIVYFLSYIFILGGKNEIISMIKMFTGKNN